MDVDYQCALCSFIRKENKFLTSSEKFTYIIMKLIRIYLCIAVYQINLPVTVQICVVDDEYLN